MLAIIAKETEITVLQTTNIVSKNKPQNNIIDDDPTASDRKKDHINLAFESHVAESLVDSRFYYEPVLAGHPTADFDISNTFAGYHMRTPIWVSSMTGGTALAKIINKNLAKACGEYGMGMGLGSCRSLLKSDEYLNDFAVKKHMPDQPLYANLGIAQVEQLIDNNELHLITELLAKLEADGLMIHINPLQEWLQPEGDFIKYPPVETITKVLEKLDISIIVKEVGQGMGPQSLKALMQLPIDAIEFAAHGGTNFAQLELLRSSDRQQQLYGSVAMLGHSAADMTQLYNSVAADLGDNIQCDQVIVSGGVKNFLDGYYHTNNINANAIFGQASPFLKHARGDYESLRQYVQSQIKGLQLAHAMLTIRR